MPIPVENLELALNSPEGFFNDLEESLKNVVVGGGSGVYKLTQDGNGLFLAIEPVTEIPDEAVLDENGRRYYTSDENHLYLFVRFLVAAPEVPPV